MVSNILTWVNENHARLVGCRPGAYRVLRHDGKEFCPNLLADAPLGSFVVYCHMYGSEVALLVQCRMLRCMYGACMQRSHCSSMLSLLQSRVRWRGNAALCYMHSS